MINVSYIDLYSNTVFSEIGTILPSGNDGQVLKEARLKECGKRNQGHHCTKHQPDMRRRMAVLLRGEAFRHSGSIWCIMLNHRPRAPTCPLVGKQHDRQTCTPDGFQRQAAVLDDHRALFEFLDKTHSIDVDVFAVTRPCSDPLVDAQDGELLLSFWYRQWLRAPILQVPLLLHVRSYLKNICIDINCLLFAVLMLRPSGASEKRLMSTNYRRFPQPVTTVICKIEQPFQSS